MTNLITNLKFGIEKDSISRLIIGIALVVTIIATINLYWSPLVLQSNQQVTESEFTMGQWFSEHGSNEYTRYEIGYSMYRFGHAIRGFPPSSFKRNGKLPGDGFEIREGNNGTVLIYTTLGIEFYPNLFPEYESEWRYTPHDVSEYKLRNQVVYTSGETGVVISRGQ